MGKCLGHSYLNISVQNSRNASFMTRKNAARHSKIVLCTFRGHGSSMPFHRIYGCFRLRNFYWLLLFHFRFRVEIYCNSASSGLRWFIVCFANATAYKQYTISPWISITDKSFHMLKIAKMGSFAFGGTFSSWDRDRQALAENRTNMKIEISCSYSDTKVERHGSYS